MISDEDYEGTYGAGEYGIYVYVAVAPGRAARPCAKPTSLRSTTGLAGETDRQSSSRSIRKDEGEGAERTRPPADDAARPQQRLAFR